MGDFVDRDLVIAKIEERALLRCHAHDAISYMQLKLTKWEIVDLPAADVRPVVLCRDCIFRSNEWTGCPKLNGTITGDEFFCKCGIKREES